MELKCPNFAQYLGFFSLLSNNYKDDIDQYSSNKLLPKKFCSKNGINNYFIFMSYFPLGSIADYIPKNKNELISIINQIIASLTLAYEKLNFLHNDLHPANILIKKTTKKNITYNFINKNITIETHGLEIVLFDFDRSSFNGEFHNLLIQLSVFLGTYELVLNEKKVFDKPNRPFKDLMKEFLQIVNIESLKNFIGDV